MDLFCVLCDIKYEVHLVFYCFFSIVYWELGFIKIKQILGNKNKMHQDKLFIVHWEIPLVPAK